MVMETTLHLLRSNWLHPPYTGIALSLMAFCRRSLHLSRTEWLLLSFAKSRRLLPDVSENVSKGY